MMETWLHVTRYSVLLDSGGHSRNVGFWVSDRVFVSNLPVHNSLGYYAGTSLFKIFWGKLSSTFDLDVETNPTYI